MGLSYVLYKVFLSRRKSFLFNRMFLLAAILGLSIAPFVSNTLTTPGFINTSSPQIVDLFHTFSQTSAINDTPTLVTPSLEDQALSFDWTFVFYAIALLLLFRIMWNVTNMILMVIRGYQYSIGNIRIIKTNYLDTPFAFFSNLFLSNEELEKGISEEMFEHEKCHIKHYHSLDLIIVELLFTLQWWNPFMHLLKRELKVNHEYTADQYSIKAGNNSDSLIDQLLLKANTNNRTQSLQLGFSHNSTVNRIKMINQKDNKMSRVSTFILSLSILFVIASCTDSSIETYKENQIVEVTSILDEHTKLEYVYPTSIASQVEDLGLLTGFIEYKPPSLDLFKKFTSDSSFTIYLDDQKVTRTTVKNLIYNDIKAYKVFETIHVTGKSDYEAKLFTQTGYFEMMHEAINRIKDLEILSGNDKTIDPLWRSLAKYE